VAVRRANAQSRNRASAEARKRGSTTRSRAFSSRPPEPTGPVGQFFSRYRRVGLDTSCFIYHLSKHLLYMTITADLFTMIEVGRLSAVTSSLALIEILARPKQVGLQAAADNYKVVLSTFPHLELRRADIAITELAADLRVRYRVTTPEAIQLATAIVDDAEAFIGNTEPLRAVKEIEVVLLEDIRASTVAQRRA
jgi:predicted nucleic acid-binding protein